MTYTPTPIEQVFRSVREGYCDELMDLTRPENDGMLAPWMRLKMRMEKMCVDIQTVCDDIAARPSMNPGQASLIPASDIASPELDAVFDELESLALETAEKREAARIDAAHPVVLSPLSDALRIVRPA